VTTTDIASSFFTSDYSITMEGTTDPRLLGESTWLVHELAAEYPPVWEHENKQAVANIVGDDCTTSGNITVSRWTVPEGLPTTMTQCHHVRLAKGYYTYEDAPLVGDTTTYWYMNFADPYLFGYGETELLAQDELQTLEHPILSSLAKAIEEGKHGQPGLLRRTTEPTYSCAAAPRQTQDHDICATPVLVEGAPRRCHFDTSQGLYGDGFAWASVADVEDAATRIDPPTRSNILAVSAMPPRCGLYVASQINYMYESAYTGFRAVVLRSGRVTVHTGHWGCGAFGGNKGLVAALQILAAGAAGVEQLVYCYGFVAQDRLAVEHGIQVAAVLHGKPWSEAVRLLESAGYRWGDANENHVPYKPPDNDLVQLLTQS